MKSLNVIQHCSQLNLCNNEIHQASLQGRLSRYEPAVIYGWRVDTVVNSTGPLKERQCYLLSRFIFVYQTKYDEKTHNRCHL